MMWVVVWYIGDNLMMYEDPERQMSLRLFVYRQGIAAPVEHRLHSLDVLRRGEVKVHVSFKKKVVKHDDEEAKPDAVEKAKPHAPESLKRLSSPLDFSRMKATGDVAASVIRFSALGLRFYRSLSLPSTTIASIAGTETVYLMLTISSMTPFQEIGEERQFGAPVPVQRLFGVGIALHGLSVLAEIFGTVIVRSA
ncbi:unnamed protein product [Symbiodinium microadriaticum]|nr:unnamed protein product [Symbiodinium microadriaticum]